MKTFFKMLYKKFGKISPFLFTLVLYKRSFRKIKQSSSGKEKLNCKLIFNNFVKQYHGKRCLQIGVKDNIGRKYGPNWVSVDLYDKRDFIDFNYDVQNLDFEDECFYAIVCWSILEHIPYPQKAIKEMYRVLKPSGEIWIQLPFLFPYHKAPKDYWRVTPDGLRIWLKDFQEISCDFDFWNKTSLVAATYFYGKK